MRAQRPWLEAAARTTLAAADTFAPGRLNILVFHRVLPQPDTIFPDEMHASRFDRLMALVASTFRVMTLGDAVAARETGRLPKRALVVTFDDGYADNAEIAMPLLQRHGLVATFFVATGFLDGGRMFNDTVIEGIRAARDEPIDLTEWDLGVRSMRSAQDRRSVIAALLPKVKYLPLAQRPQFLDRFLRLLGRPQLPDHLMMRSEQVRALHSAGMEIGGHTVNHPILRVLDDQEARAEMGNGRRQLQDLTGAPVEVFAYPNGRPHQDYDMRHVVMARELGFRCAVTTAAGLLTPETDLYQIPRFTPWETGRARWLSRVALMRLQRSRADAVDA